MTAVAAKDLEAVPALFAGDAVMFDPHYPIPLMAGKGAIRSGFEWAFGRIQQPGFALRHFWAGEDNAVEVATQHMLPGGLELNFPQVFVLEWRGGLIVRLQAYGPYPPPRVPTP